MINIDFIKPLEAHNNVEFILEPQGDATQVTWAMYGSAPFAAKVMRVFVPEDQGSQLLFQLAAQHGMQSDVVDQTVALVDGWLEANRQKAA